MGYDNRKAWKNIVRAKAAEFAKIYNISLNNLVVNAAYHDKDYHPHIHLLFYSTDSREGYVKDMAKATDRFKSLFFNEIFREDVSYLKEKKTEQRNELDAALEKSMKRLYSKEYSPPMKLPSILLDLSEKLKTIDGKKVYGFLPPEVKSQVDKILKYALTEDQNLNAVFSLYCGTQKEFIRQYIDDEAKIENRMQRFQNAILSPGKNDPKTLQNIIVRYAVLLGGATDTPSAGEVTMQKESEVDRVFPDADDAPPYPEDAMPGPENSGKPRVASGSGTTMQKEDADNRVFPDAGDGLPPPGIAPPGHKDRNQSGAASGNGITIQKEKKSSAAYAALLLLRELAYVIGKDTRQDSTFYDRRCNAFHLSQVRRRFVYHKKQQQRNIADEITY